MADIDLSQVKWDEQKVDLSQVKWDDAKESAPASPASLTDALRPEFVKGSGNPFSAGIAQGAAGLASLPIQTIQNVLNLSRAGAGSVMGALGLTDMMPSADVQLPGNFQSVLKGLSALGLQTENPRPDDPMFRAAEIAGGNVPAMAIPGATAGQTALSTAGQVVGEQVGGDTGRVIGAVAPAAVSAAYSAARAPGLAASQKANAVQDRIAEAAKAEKLTIPPVQTNPGSMTNQVLQGLVSGKARTEMVASNKNQPVVNAIARRELGMPKGSELTDETLAALRSKAGDSYQAVKDFGAKNNLQMKQDPKFQNDLSKLGGDFQSISSKFPEIAKNEGADMLRSAFAGKTITPTEAVELTKKLRADASKNYKAFNDPARLALADAQKGAANAVEGLLERTLSRSGQGQLLKDFKDARKLYAKSYDVEASLVGGNVDARVLARAVKADKPITGGLRTVGEAAGIFKDAFRPPNPGYAQQFSLFDTFAGGAAATGLGSGQHAIGLGALAIPAARFATRQGILSGPYQNSLGTPSYTPAVQPDSALAALLRGNLAGNMTQ